MKRMMVIFDDAHLKHKPPFSHPERPERVTSVYNFLKVKKFFDEAELIRPEKVSKENILSVHTPDYYNFVIDSINTDRRLLDGGDTYIVKDSLEPALLSTGAVVKAVDLVMSNSFSSVFSLMRPPGHHAETTRPMGFCIFNNVAVGAKYALQKYRVERVAVVDWDVHHGNGTQEIFYNTSKLLFISLHQYPFYPGTGSSDETGTGEGEGYTLNFPLPAGTTGKIYLEIFKEKIIKKLNNYSPQLLFISAGFDSHKDDPIANMLLTEDDFSEMTKYLRDFAGKNNIKIISVLEGGYNLNALASSVFSHLKILNE